MHAATQAFRCRCALNQARDTQAMSIEVVLSKAPATEAQAANGHGLQSGHLCVRRHRRPVDQHFSTLAAGDRGRPARIQRGRHFDHHGFSGDFCRRTIDCRPVVGPVRAAKADPDRALHLRARNDMVRVRGRSVGSADRPIDTSFRRMCRCRAVTRHCPGSVRRPGAGKDDGVDHDRNRGRSGILSSRRQRA